MAHTGGNCDWNAVTGTPDEMAARLRLYAETGSGSVQVWLHPKGIDGVEAFAPVLKKMR